MRQKLNTKACIQNVYISGGKYSEIKIVVNMRVVGVQNILELMYCSDELFY